MAGVADTGYFAISTESTAGTAETTPEDFLQVEEVNFEWENEFIDVRTIQGSRQAVEVLDGAVRPSATVRSPLYASGAVGRIFYGLLGGYSTAVEGSSATAQRHTFEDAASLPSFTLERADARQGEGGLLCQRMAGAKVESVSMSCAFGEKVDLEVQFQATKKPVTATAVADGSVVYPTETPMYFLGAVVEVDDVASTDFKSVQLEMRNTLERQDSLRGSAESYIIAEGGFDVTLSGMLTFDSLDMYNRFSNGTEMKVEFIFTSDTAAAADGPGNVYYLVHVTMPKVKISRLSIPYTAGGVIEADATFRVLYDKTTGVTITPEIVNLDAASAYDAA
jgi:hypothetical protein